MTDKEVFKVNGPTDPSLRSFWAPMFVTIARNDIRGKKRRKKHTQLFLPITIHTAVLRRMLLNSYFHNMLHYVFLSGSNQWYIIQ